jgi:hypothetical protein
MLSVVLPDSHLHYFAEYFALSAGRGSERDAERLAHSVPIQNVAGHIFVANHQNTIRAIPTF